MTRAIASIPIDDLTHSVTFEINIVGYRGWLARLALAKILMRLACWVAGVNVEINEGGNE